VDFFNAQVFFCIGHKYVIVHNLSSEEQSTKNQIYLSS